jgi:hypothetical protein
VGKYLLEDGCVAISKKKMRSDVSMRNTSICQGSGKWTQIMALGRLNHLSFILLDLKLKIQKKTDYFGAIIKVILVQIK